MNREQKKKANRKRFIYEKYVKLYREYVRNQKWEYCCDLIAMMKKQFGSNDKKQFGKYYSHSEIFINGDEPYIISTIIDNGNVYNIKVSKKNL